RLPIPALTPKNGWKWPKGSWDVGNKADIGGTGNRVWHICPPSGTFHPLRQWLGFKPLDGPRPNCRTRSCPVWFSPVPAQKSDRPSPVIMLLGFQQKRPSPPLPCFQTISFPPGFPPVF